MPDGPPQPPPGGRGGTPVAAGGGGSGSGGGGSGGSGGGGGGSSNSGGGRAAAASRGSRSANMVGDLLDADVASPQRSVPNWLIEEQKQHVRLPEAAQQPKAMGKAAAGGAATATRGRAADAAEHEHGAAHHQPRVQPGGPVKKTDSVDDYIMVDLLDAAHIPAVRGAQAAAAAASSASAHAQDAVPNLMSTAADSILSLPPMANQTRWHTLRAQAQEARMQGRRSSFGNRRPGKQASGTPAKSPPMRRDGPKAANQTSVSQPSEPESNSTSADGGRRFLVTLTASAKSTEPPPVRPVDPAVSPALPVPLSVHSVQSLDDRPPVPSLREHQDSNRLDALPGAQGSRDRLLPDSSPEDRRLGRRQRSEELDTPGGLEGASGRSRASSTGPLPLRSTRGGLDELSKQSSTGSQRSVSRTSEDYGSSRGRQLRGKRKAASVLRDSIYPHMWEWKRPADEDAVIPGRAWLYLALIGASTFAIAWLVNLLSLLMSKYVIGGISLLMLNAYGVRAETCFQAGARALCLVLSFLTVRKYAPRFGAGSGIPEMKCVLSGVYMPKALSLETLIAKVVGLVLSLSSGISIGRLGPFIHISGICASLVARMPVFPVLSSSARFQLQAVSCAMAAGVGATFGAPIGGAMLSIELMSTYYYIHWLPLALYCSIMGYYCISVVVPADAQAYFVASVSVGITNHSVFKLITYVLLGAICGVTGAFLVHYTIAMFEIRTRYMTFETPVRSCIVLALFAALHSLVVVQFGEVLQVVDREGIHHLFNDEKIAIPEKAVENILVFSDSRLNAALFLFVASASKFLLTGISLILPVPAGTFMPIFEIGALLGRGVGEIFASFDMVTWIDPRACAIVGAAGVASGTLHTVSIAIVMLEVTRQAIDVLPLAVGVIVSYGVSKHLCSDLFSELIKVRRLPFILGLRERYPKENKLFYDRVAKVSAGQFMSKSFPFVTPQSTAGEVRGLLSGSASDGAWGTCAFLSNARDLRLWGTVSRSVLFEAVNPSSPSTSPPSSVNPLSLSNKAEMERPRARPSPPGRSSIPAVSGREANMEYGTFSKEAEALADSDTITMLREYNPKVGHRQVDMAPFSVSSRTPFWKVATYFRMLGLSSMYVMEDGRVVGYLTKSQFIKHTFKVEDEARLERAREWREERELAELQALQQAMSTGGRRPTGPGSGRIASRFSQQDLQLLAAQPQRNQEGMGRVSRWLDRR